MKIRLKEHVAALPIRISTLIAAAIILSLFLSACSNENTGPADGDTEEPKVEAPKNEPANLVVFSGGGTPEEAWNQRFGNDLKEKFPHYTITYVRNGDTTLAQMITAGEQVDIIYDSVGGAGNTVISNGFQYDLSGLVQKHNIDLNRFEPTMLEAVRQFGGLYGFPVQGGGLVMYYNKDIFDRFGVDYPKDGMFWEEAIEIGRRMTRIDEGTPYIGLGPSFNHVMSMNSYSLPLVDYATGRATINNDKFKTLVETVILASAQIDVYREKITALNRSFNNNDFMVERFIAMYFMNYGLQDQEAFSSMNWDMAAIPVFQDKPGVGTQPYPNIMFIANNSEYKDQALEILNYVTSDEYQMISSRKGFIPVLKDKAILNAFGQDTRHKDKNLVNAMFSNQFADPIARTRFDSSVTSPLIRNIISVIKGDMDLNTALRTTEESANQAIETAKQ